MDQPQLDRSKLGRVAAAQGSHLSRSALNALLAPELERRLGYRSAGITAEQARDQVFEEFQRQRAVRVARAEQKPRQATPGRILGFAEDKARNLAETARVRAACRPLLVAQAQAEHASVQLGDIVFRAVEVGAWNYSRYSKGWHSLHGGVWEVEERRVDMLQPGPLGTLQVVQSVQVAAFRGHWLVRAIASLLGLPKPRVPAVLRPVQGMDLFSVEPVGNHDGGEVYRRMLGPLEVDYCAVRDGITYHGASPQDALIGLEQKIAANAGAPSAPQEDRITVRTGLRLGFCRAGMKDFCDCNDLDIDRTYTRTELRAVVEQRREMNEERWGRELRRLGVL